MRVELYSLDGCPNWTVAEERLRQALDGLDQPHVAVERHRVETAEEAERVQFIGSPTIRIDGCDPFATGAEQVGLACRVYATPNGLGISPAVEQLTRAMS